MSLPEEEQQLTSTNADDQDDNTADNTDNENGASKATLSSIAPSGVLEKMFKMPVVKQVKQKLESSNESSNLISELESENLIVKAPSTMELSDIPSFATESTESFVQRHLRPGTKIEDIDPSFYYHDIPAIELDLYEKYLKDEVSLQELEKTKNHMSAVNVHLHRKDILNAKSGELLSQASQKIVKELELGNLDPFMAEALVELVNVRRRKLAGFSRRVFLQECDIRKLCEEAYTKTKRYVAEQGHHWTIAKAFESLEKGQSDFALQIITLTKEIEWPQDVSELFWRKLRLSTFRNKPELTLEQVQENNKVLEQITREMKEIANLSESDVKNRWEQINRNEALEDLHEDLWCLGVAEGMRITTGTTHNDVAEKSGLPVSYDYSRFDPITMWFLVGLHKKNADEFHKYVLDSEKSGYNFWLSYVKNASDQSKTASMKSSLA